jgi:hypothetical protein
MARQVLRRRSRRRLVLPVRPFGESGRTMASAR